ncbi:EamA family transporter [Mucisphaera sp.]|uniref:EamA family transporter n=1 Tax=Mucisphaera sp. TaxID=2913024 RepID=UPI003D0C1383
MSSSFYLVYPLIAAILYALSAWFMKASQRCGLNSAQVTLWAMAATAVSFMAVHYPWLDQPWREAVAWGPIVALAVMFYLGLAATVVALDRGAVSLATPMLGTKVVLVAVLDAFGAGGLVSSQDWIAAVLSMVGVIILACSGNHGEQGGHEQGLSRDAVWIGLSVSFVAALSFSAFDVGVKHWSLVHGFGQTVPLAMVVAVGLCLTLPKVTGEPVFVWPPSGRSWLVLGSLLFAAQALILIWSLGVFGDPTGINVVYGTRGVWSVLLVGVLATLTPSVERFGSRRAFVLRLSGSLVISAAIVVLLL